MRMADRRQASAPTAPPDAATRLAVILAAGAGSRLTKASDGPPKPLVPVLGMPVLERAVRACGEAGIDRIDKRISPHSLRHSFIMAALDAGVALRDVQEAASHADPRTTMRYDPARRSLDRHATYIVATFVAGASR